MSREKAQKAQKRRLFERFAPFCGHSFVGYPGDLAVRTQGTVPCISPASLIRNVTSLPKRVGASWWPGGLRCAVGTQTRPSLVPGAGRSKARSFHEHSVSLLTPGFVPPLFAP